MSIGMGTPLLIVGASAGKLLPKAGPWMDTVKKLFGVMMLGVAAWMLARIVPERLTLLLWAVPALVCGWLAFLPSFHPAVAWLLCWRGSGVCCSSPGSLVCDSAADLVTDGFRFARLCVRIGQLTDEILGEPPDGRIVEYRGRVDRERAAELTVQPVAEFDRHQ